MEGAAIQMVPVPAVVCTAFSIELYLKAMLALDNVEMNVHDVVKLFKGLNLPRQEEILAEMHLTREAFAEKLAEVGSVFVEWRYIYEKQDAYLDHIFLGELSKACRTVAFRCLPQT